MERARKVDLEREFKHEVMSTRDDVSEGGRCRGGREGVDGVSNQNPSMSISNYLSIDIFSVHGEANIDLERERECVCESHMRCWNLGEFPTYSFFVLYNT